MADCEVVEKVVVIAVAKREYDADKVRPIHGLAEVVQ